MKYDFDTVYNRKNTNSIKYKKHPRYPDVSDVIPMWVADMDFKTAPEITDALQSASECGIFGYTELDDEYYDLLIKWNKKRFGFDIKRDWIVPCEGVLFGISAAIRALSKAGDSVLIMQPVYHPFLNIIKSLKRRPVVSVLNFDGQKYYIDFNDLENRIVEENVKLLLFCSPHNPVSRVWDKEELCNVVNICKRHNVIIVSDEIHSDLVFKNHFPAASLSKEAADITVAVTSVTKTFNLAGIKGANLIIANTDIRNKTEREILSTCAGEMGIMSAAAAKAAYRHGEEWLQQLLKYLKSNADYVIESFENTKIKPIAPEGTYLMWLDCRKLGLNSRELEEFFIRDCGVWMSSGFIFGEGGNGFMRMNIACPKSVLEKAITQIKKRL
ncbi:MAG: pyridoxal phosphate-dependent aminotransferase [Clostridia bacterium]|nr:pyridoxal phosphate-dependent aminotransferase [Clostridia bacterium]